MRYLLILSLLFISPVWAQADSNPPGGTHISLSAMAETDLANDEVAVQFRVSSPTMNDAQDALQLQVIRKFHHKA